VSEPIVITVNPPDVVDVTVEPPPVVEVEISTGVPVPGPAGPGLAATVAAGETLSGHRAVALHSDRRAYYASNDQPTDATRQIWITLGAAIEGTDVQIQPLGIIVEPSWNWDDGPIFLGTSGVLTQVPPVQPAFLMQVAQPNGPTSLIFNPRTPIVL